MAKRSTVLSLAATMDLVIEVALCLAFCVACESIKIRLTEARFQRSVTLSAELVVDYPKVTIKKYGIIRKASGTNGIPRGPQLNSSSSVAMLKTDNTSV